MSDTRLLLAEYKFPTASPHLENTLTFELVGEAILVSSYTLWDANECDWDSHTAAVPVRDFCVAIDQVLVHTASQVESFEVRTPDNLCHGSWRWGYVRFSRSGNNFTLDISDGMNSIVGVNFSPFERLQALKQALGQV